MSDMQREVLDSIEENVNRRPTTEGHTISEIMVITDLTEPTVRSMITKLLNCKPPLAEFIGSRNYKASGGTWPKVYRLDPRVLERMKKKK